MSFILVLAISSQLFAVILPTLVFSALEEPFPA